MGGSSNTNKISENFKRYESLKSINSNIERKGIGMTML